MIQPATSRNTDWGLAGKGAGRTAAETLTLCHCRVQDHTVRIQISAAEHMYMSTTTTAAAAFKKRKEGCDCCGEATLLQSGSAVEVVYRTAGLHESLLMDIVFRVFTHSFSSGCIKTFLWMRPWLEKPGWTGGTFPSEPR